MQKYATVGGMPVPRHSNRRGAREAKPGARGAMAARPGMHHGPTSFLPFCFRVTVPEEHMPPTRTVTVIVEALYPVRFRLPFVRNFAFPLLWVTKMEPSVRPPATEGSLVQNC